MLRKTDWSFDYHSSLNPKPKTPRSHNHSLISKLSYSLIYTHLASTPLKYLSQASSNPQYENSHGLDDSAPVQRIRDAELVTQQTSLRRGRDIGGMIWGGVCTVKYALVCAGMCACKCVQAGASEC